MNSITEKINGYNKIILLNMVGMVLCKGMSVCITLFLFPMYISFFENNEILGAWFTIVSILNWVLIFDIGLGNGLRNRLTEVLSNNDLVLARKYISTSYVVAFIFSILLFFLIKFIGVYADWNSILNIGRNLISNEVLGYSVNIILGGICFQFIMKMIISILYALQKSALVNLMGVLSNVIILFSLLIINRGSVEENLISMAYVNVFALNVPMVLFTIYTFNNTLKDMVPNIKSFDKNLCRELLDVGLVLLWLQIIFLIVSNTNEFLISFFTGSNNVVMYQAYMRIYNTGAMIFSFALTPVWSAVTKAKAEGNYSWIKKIYKFFIAMSFLCLLVGLCISFFGQFIFDIWIGNDVVEFNFIFGVIFSIHSFIFIIHNVNTSISNGLSYFKFQMIGMSLAAVIHVPLAYILVSFSESWIGVLLASILSMLFYEGFAPYFTFRYIKNLN